MIADPTITTTATLGSLTLPATRRGPPARALVLSQSWVPFRGAHHEHSDLRRSTLRAAQALSLLSSQLATRRGGETSSTN